MGTDRARRLPSASALLDASVFVLGLLVLAGSLLWWRADGAEPGLLTALAISLPTGWVLTRFPLMVTGETTGIYVPFAPVLLFFLLTAHGRSPATALLAWTLTALFAYLVDRRSWTSRVFNAGSSMLSALLATVVVVGLRPADPVTPQQLLAVLAGAAGYFLLDNVLSAVSVAVEHRRGLAGELLQPGTALGGALFLLVASLGYLAAAVDLAMPGWVTNLTVVPGAAVVVAAWGWRTAHQRRRQQHALFEASVRVHSATNEQELLAALVEHGSALVSGGRLTVSDRAPGEREVGRELPGGPGAGAPRWIVAVTAGNRHAQRFDDAALDALGLLGGAALVRVRLAEEAGRQALVDPLTGLPNRRAFTAHLDRAVDRDAAIAVLFVDLDGFKAVNDTLGHGAGDELLAETARRLVRAAGAEGFAARLGGDEFAVVLPDLFPGAADDTAEAVVAALHEPFLLAAGPATISASVGITASEPGDDADTLLSRADAAMYVAKRAGGDAHVLASPEL
ncbi:diguanylate cyclase domain-containing protein [Kineococcus sp. SYSU DK003]|uniref:diguanylate cyclase domain-containing protein n=1 Tax=Kineococcus sp. SYSU DK003 TaxID=3383124 RepID=UPI003D7DB939